MNGQAERFFQQRLCASFQGGQEYTCPHIIHFLRARTIEMMTHQHSLYPSLNALSQGIQNQPGSNKLQCRLAHEWICSRAPECNCEQLNC
jgi:hypothetical protein